MRIITRYLLAAAVFVLPISGQQSDWTEPTYRQIYEFPSDPFTDIENIAVRSNGQLLLNVITAPSVFTLDPMLANPSPKLVHTFSETTSMTGIIEVSPDVFAVATGNITWEEFEGYKGTWSVWTIDFRGSETPAITKITSIPEVTLLNGMTSMPGTTDLILMCESVAGQVWSLNTTSGQYLPVIQDAAFLPSTTFPLGINGIRTFGRELYFTNSALGTFGRLPLAPNATATGPIQILCNLPPGSQAYDDFAITSDGISFVTDHPTALTKVYPDGAQIIYLNSTDLIQPTSVVLGRGSEEQECIAYVVTAGVEAEGKSGQVNAVNIC